MRRGVSQFCQNVKPSFLLEMFCSLHIAGLSAQFMVLRLNEARMNSTTNSVFGDMPPSRQNFTAAHREGRYIRHHCEAAFSTQLRGGKKIVRVMKWNNSF